MPQLNELPLRDIHLPDPISWWPLAFGWWLAFGAGCVLILATYILLRKYFKPTLRKEAINTLDCIEKTFHAHEDAVASLCELSTFLRRAMLSQKNAIDIAGVTGEAWLELLDQQLASHEFSQGVGRILLHGPYLPAVDKQEVTALFHLCRRWVKTL